MTEKLEKYINGAPALRTVSLLLAVVIIFSFAVACGVQSEEDGSPTLSSITQIEPSTTTAGSEDPSAGPGEDADSSGSASPDAHPGTETEPQTPDITTADYIVTTVVTETTTVIETTVPTPPADPPTVAELIKDPLSGTVSTTPLENNFSTKAPHAAIYDMTTGELIFAKGLTDKIYPASTTKLLTALYALTIADLDDVCTIGDDLNKVASDASTVKLKKKEKYTIEQLMYGMLLSSGNDAAYSIATFCGRKAAGNMSLDVDSALALFMACANEYGRQIGMLNSHFTVPDGYHDDEHYTTVYDMLVLSKAVLQNATIVEITSTYKYVFTDLSGNLREYVNRNALVVPDGQYYYPNVIGLKTGMTSAAGNCLIAAVRSDDDHIIVTMVFGLDSKSTNVRYTESIKLLDYALGK